MTRRLVIVLQIGLLALPLVATASQSGDFLYETNGIATTITGYKRNKGVINIPEKINGLPVTSIGDAAFVESKPTSVAIPVGVTNIGDLAFAFSRLTNINIPSGVIRIGDYAFEDNMSLVNIALLNGLAEIGKDAFWECFSLDSVTIPPSVERIRSSFGHCLSLKALVVDPDNKCYSSLDGVLYNKKQTELVAFPPGKATERYAIPKGVNSVAGGAFAGCPNLVAIELPDGVTHIGKFAFYACRELSSITVPASVTNIEKLTFQRCGKLTSVLFLGNAPTITASMPPDDPFKQDTDKGVFDECSTNLTVYHLPTSKGWIGFFDGHPTTMVKRQE